MYVYRLLELVFLEFEASFSFHFRDWNGLVRLFGSQHGPSRSLQPTSTPSQAGEGRGLRRLEIPTTEGAREGFQRAHAESRVKLEEQVEPCDFPWNG